MWAINCVIVMSVHATSAVLWLHVDGPAAVKSENVTCAEKTRQSD